MSVSHLNHLVSPVLFRANAHEQRRFGCFSDRFARSVLTKMSITTPFRQPHSKVTQNINHCKWIDSRVLDFLEAHPFGEGMEILGGLSTRFYRLSESLEWPRFCWTSINTENDNNYLSKVFPATDNFKRIVSPKPNTQWYNAVSFSDDRQRIAIVAENAPIETASELIETISPFISVCEIKRMCLDLIISHRVKNTETTLALLGSNIETISSYACKTSLFTGLVVGESCTRITHHLRISCLDKELTQ